MPLIVDVTPKDTTIEAGPGDHAPVRFVFVDQDTGDTARVSFSTEALQDFLTKLVVLTGGTGD